MSELLAMSGMAGSYRIENVRPFAYGRTSVLFEGSDQDGLPVCIKIFRDTPRTPSGDTQLHEFVHQLRAQMELKHPHILPILDYGLGTTEDMALFLVVPLCRGGSLRVFMRQRDFVPLGTAMPILQQVALAIDFAHERGFIHGDIKPENILFSEDASHAYLSDFGMSKYFAIEEHISTRPFSEGGSTAYLSPEQINDGKQSPRSDIYSFAVVAYELLTGSLPFDVTLPPFRQMQAKVRGDLIDPHEANALLARSTRDALLQGLHVDRRRRPRSAAELCRRLAQLESSDAAGVGGLIDLWARLAPRSKAAIIAALITGIGTVAAAIVRIVPDLLK